MITTTAIIIVAICGVCAAVIYSYFIRSVPGKLIHTLSEKKASSKESALSLSELGYSGILARILYTLLSKNSVLRRFIATYYDAEAEEAGVVSLYEKGKVKAQKYYLIPEKQEDALRRYKNNGTNLVSVIICLVLLVLAAIVFVFFAPYMENFIDGIPGMFDNETEIKGAVVDNVETIYPKQEEAEEEEKAPDAESAQDTEAIDDEDNSDISEEEQLGDAEAADAE